MSFFEDILKGLEETIEMEGGKKLHKIQKISVIENESLIVTFEDGTSKMYDAQTLCKIIPQLEKAEITELLKNAKVDVGGHVISLNEDLVLWADDIWELGTKIMEFISNYMNDDTYRHMLNELTQKTFGFDFENWVTQGYFEGDYIPYSFMSEGRIISNVSVNRMKFMQNGVMKSYIQIGTVMTDENYRKQGLAAELMKYVIEKYEKECEGIYLFGDLSALEFYQKMNFSIENEYRYYVKDEFCNCEKIKDMFKPIKNMDDNIKEKYLDLVRNSAYHSSFEQMNKYGLQMFYTSGLDNVFYAEDIECFIVLEQDECAVLKSVLCKRKIALVDVLQRIDIGDHKCRLGFTPHDEDMNICISEVYDGGSDYKLFYRGKELESIEQDKLYFPDLSHA